ncbi:gastrula zinc finger protein XlCGF71.1-like [Copidosoma floridanum]|uniref:gastrula zinc finger protein XlCGF71.1-like n=1 Tax=Copidosoma floridanum TaxID=29053 RepID=UPI0006C975FA|nr:gastrula zinc finger protein XlCGF71.1-like [Copidosoma floridanum]
MLTHTNERPYVCTKCPQAFRCRFSLMRHEVIHTGEKSLSCSVCQKRFADPSSFRRHKLIHTGEKPYGCSICQKHFTRSSDLKNHKLIHTGEKPFSCSVCQRRFSDSSNFIKHKRTHTVDNSSYHTCSKNSDTRPNLMNDQPTHASKESNGSPSSKSFNQNVTNPTNHSVVWESEEKPFECFMCKKSFVRKYQWEIHSNNCE